MKKNKKGFTFVEAIISIFLLSVGMVAVMTLISSSLKDSLDIKNQLIGGLLAQEGVELVRNLRDNNWASSPITSFKIKEGGLHIFPPLNRTNCMIDFNDTVLTCQGNDSRRLFMDPDTGIYYHGDDFNHITKFTRKIIVDYDTGRKLTANEAEVTSFVYWGDNPGNDIDNSTCNTASKCAFSRITLNKWGE